MASAAHTTNVTLLPTAARRKVVHDLAEALPIAAKNLPKHPARWPANHESGRRAWQEAHFTRSPEMLIVAAIMKVLSDPQKKQVRKYIADLVDFDIHGCGPHAVTALTIAEAIK